MKKSTTILPALLLLLLVRPGGVLFADGPTAPEASMEEALLDAASRAGYAFVRGNASHCPVDCESGVDACGYENRHKTLVSEEGENRLGKGPHEECRAGTCAPVRIRYRTTRCTPCPSTVTAHTWSAPKTGTGKLVNSSGATTTPR